MNSFKFLEIIIRQFTKNSQIPFLRNLHLLTVRHIDFTQLPNTAIVRFKEDCTRKRPTNVLTTNHPMKQ